MKFKQVRVRREGGANGCSPARSLGTFPFLTPRLAQMVYHLEQSVEELKECSKNREAYNPLVYVAQLAAGCVAALVSVLWVAHVVVYMIIDDPPLSLMLNAFLIQVCVLPLNPTTILQLPIILPIMIVLIILIRTRPLRQRVPHPGVCATAKSYNY